MELHSYRSFARKPRTPFQKFLCLKQWPNCVETTHNVLKRPRLLSFVSLPIIWLCTAGCANTGVLHSPDTKVFAKKGARWPSRIIEVTWENPSGNNALERAL